MVRRLQAIENELTSINETVFQELCDSFLTLRNKNFSLFSRIGSVSGRQKTRVGTPDSFFLLPNGKYLFVEHSTNITSGVSKLKDDLEKCLDTEKTGIPTSDIAEIIFCINFNLNTKETKELSDLLEGTTISLTIYTLDFLAIELHLNHRDLVHHYLGLPFDSGQIVSITKFVDEYNRASTGIATPLDNKFVHREKEVCELTDAMNTADFVILTGAPGVGKTKLAIETIEGFLLANDTYQGYCVSYKNHTLLDDLFQYLDTNEDYILFVDDANRIDAFNQIVGFYRASRKGNLKVIITVRDYAFSEVARLCLEFKPVRIDIFKLTDEQLVDVLKTDSFNILNTEYQREIVRIADGNPRLAIMAALLAKEKQSIYALSDVSDLFDSYFSTFIKDYGEFDKSLNIKCLGLIAFFYTLPYKKRELMDRILENYDINYFDFIEAIDNLDRLELVEVQFEHVKISEQNLSTYFFYKTFIKDEVLSFDVLLERYFMENEKRFKDCVIPANNTFGYNNVMGKLKPRLQKYWNIAQKEQEIAFKFIETFWFYLQNETLEFLFNNINSMPEVSVEEYKVTYKKNSFSYGNTNEIIDLLGEFFRFPDNLADSLELAFEFTRRCPQHLPELIHKIRTQLVFDRSDERTNFIRQTMLIDLLIKGVISKDKLLTVGFLEITKDLLGFKFHHTKAGRNNTVYWYDYDLTDTDSIQVLRQKIWETVNNCFADYPAPSLEILNYYLDDGPDLAKEIAQWDVRLILTIIENHFTCDSFLHCRYVQDLARWCRRYEVRTSVLDEVTQKYRNSTYEMYIKIDWDLFRDKELYGFENYEGYARLKEAEIRSSFIFYSTEEIQLFYDKFTYLKQQAKNDYYYTRVLEYIIDENCLKDFNLGTAILRMIIDTNNTICYIPSLVFRNQLKDPKKASIIWGLIQQRLFNLKTHWILSFFDYADDSVANTDELLKSISKTEDSFYLQFDGLHRYLTIKPDLFQEILKIITEKNSNSGARIQVAENLYSDNLNLLRDDVELIKKSYLQQYLLQPHFDYDGAIFLEILKKDSRYMVDFIKALYVNIDNKHLSDDQREFGFVWEVDGIENEIEEVFNIVVENEPYYIGILEHYCNVFFKNIKDEYQEKAEQFVIEFVKRNYNNHLKMNIIADIGRNSLQPLFENIVLTYISLNQDPNEFFKIMWSGNGGTYSGDVIIGDLQAAEWKNILSIVSKADLGIKLIPIKKAINDKIDSCLRYGDWERERKFLEKR